MATVNQIKKQIETAEKNIAGFEKKIAMYNDRMNKAIAAINKQGANFSEADVIVTDKPYGRAIIREYQLPKEIVEKYDWEMTFRIKNNIEYRDENRRNLERETRHLENLRAELAKMEEDAARTEKENAPLEEALRNAMKDFREVWFARMADYYERHWDAINAILPEKRARFDKAKRILNTYHVRLYNHRRFRLFLENVKSECAEIITDDAALYSRPEYLEKMKEHTEKVWEAGIKKLTTKCKSFGVDETKVIAHRPEVTRKGFEVVLTDGKQRVIDARVIWAAEYSDFVSPHTRYIVTERH